MGSLAPSKPRPSPCLIQSLGPYRNLFPNPGPSDHPDSALSSSPSDSYTKPALCREPIDLESDDGDTATILRSGHPSSHNGSPEYSILDDFVRHGFTSSEILTGSSAVLHTTTSALNTTACAVRNMFSSSGFKNPTTGDTSRPSAGDDDAPWSRGMDRIAPAVVTPLSVKMVPLGWALHPLGNSSRGCNGNMPASSNRWICSSLGALTSNVVAQSTTRSRPFFFFFFFFYNHMTPHSPSGMAGERE